MWVKSEFLTEKSHTKSTDYLKHWLRQLQLDLKLDETLVSSLDVLPPFRGEFSQAVFTLKAPVCQISGHLALWLQILSAPRFALFNTMTAIIKHERPSLK